ncbi:hypothetical protein HYS00_03585 [Candidatus Microgenomates bacterium]|nr:hypothetical protein [Candidatus Microgenomates bacterium]
MSYTPLSRRALLNREKVHLKRDEMGIDLFIEVTMAIFALLVAAVVVTAYVPRLSMLIGIAAFLAVAALAVILYLFHILMKYRGDLNDHIYEARGKLHKTERLTHDHTLSVGRHTFRVTHANEHVWNFFNQTHEGQEVSVLYSPRTKIIWSIMKVN